MTLGLDSELRVQTRTWNSYTVQPSSEKLCSGWPLTWKPATGQRTEKLTPDSWAPSRVSVLHSSPRGSGIHEGEGQKYCKSRGWQVTAREGGRCTHQLSKAVTAGLRPAQCGPDKDPSMEEGKQASGPTSNQEQSTFDQGGQFPPTE